MKRFRFAFSSLQHTHSLKYLGSLPSLKNVEIVAIADTRPDVLARTAKAIGVSHAYADFHEMLARHPGLDLVIASSENAHHLEHVRAIAESGANVMSMKVPSMNLRECDAMTRVCREAGVKLFTELEMRYNAAVLASKRMIDEGAIGEVRALTATNMTLCPVASWHCIPALSYGSEVPLYPGSKRMRGGCLTDHPHIFDLARWLTGSDFRTVWATLGLDARPDLRVEENAIVLAEMSNGVRVSLDASFSRTEINASEPEMREKLFEFKPGLQHLDLLKWPKPVDVTLEVFGTKGTLLVDTFAPNIYLQPEPDEQRYVVTEGMFDHWTGLIQNVLAALEGRPSTVVSPEDNRKAVEAMNAAYDSIATGKTITLAAGE